MDFLDRLIEYIKDNTGLDTRIRIGKLSSDSESISIRPTPSGIAARYADEGVNREYGFQILIKGTNQLKVISTLESITSSLDGLKAGDIRSGNNSFKLISCKVYTTPNYVEETDREEYIYTAMFMAELQGGL